MSPVGLKTSWSKLGIYLSCSVPAPWPAGDTQFLSRPMMLLVCVGFPKRKDWRKSIKRAIVTVTFDSSLKRECRKPVLDSYFISLPTLVLFMKLLMLQPYHLGGLIKDFATGEARKVHLSSKVNLPQT